MDIYPQCCAKYSDPTIFFLSLLATYLMKWKSKTQVTRPDLRVTISNPRIMG